MSDRVTQSQIGADRIPWPIVFRALLPFAIGYFMSYLFRAVNQVIAPDLIAEFNLGPGQLGRLTSAYLLGFTFVPVAAPPVAGPFRGRAACRPDCC